MTEGEHQASRAELIKEALQLISKLNDTQLQELMNRMGYKERS